MTSVTVVVPMTIRRRGGRKQIIGPDGAPVRDGQNGPGVETTGGDPALVKALARAFRWRRILEEGRYASLRELAMAEKVDRSHLSRMLRLTLLAPALVEDLLTGRPGETPKAMFRLTTPPRCWTEQRAWIRDVEPFPRTAATVLPPDRSTQLPLSHRHRQ